MFDHFTTLCMKGLKSVINTKIFLFFIFPYLTEYENLNDIARKFFYSAQLMQNIEQNKLVVANKVKGRISKRVFQENKARQIFRKTNISYPLIRTPACAYQGVRNVRFSENFARFVFLKHSF